MIRVALIGIDNRPICYDLVQDILSTDNDIKLYMPDLKHLGGLYSSSNIDSVFEFIKTLQDVDYLIISLDTIAYGGLVTSRRTDDSYDLIKSRIERLKNIVPKKAKILAFSSIMRISNNNINEEEKEYWSKYGQQIFNWSYKSHKLGYEIKHDIPDEIIEDYINTRKRNFEINKLYLSMAHDGFFDTLIFSKDDCAQFGLNVKEANALNYLIKRDNIDNVFIKTGADEIPLVLIARALNNDSKIKINPIFIENNSKNLISKYEDISIKECVKAQLSLAKVQISNDADLNFIINNFKNEQGDLVLGDIVNNINFEYDFPKDDYFIADVNNANGADSNFVLQLLKQKTDNFFGYSAYNTSANTIGCSILTAIVKYKAINKCTYNDEAFKKLQFIRLLDDWAYQAIHRKFVRESGLKFEDALENVVPELNEYSKKISEFLNYYPDKIQYSLPWRRSFEIRIKV